ncbi:MAG: hypothetical protein NC131_17740 [Roseburia sp.]|nr:hypothetical protein [Roseburia sp.]
MTKNRRDLILAILTAVCGIVALVALAFPIYIHKETALSDYVKDYTLAEFTFGDGKNFKLSIMYLVPFLLEIFGILLTVPQLLDTEKYKPLKKLNQVFRILAIFLFAGSFAVYMAARGDAYVSEHNLSAVLNEVYNLGYAHIVAAIASIAAVILQLVNCRAVWAENKKEKSKF